MKDFLFFLIKKLTKFIGVEMEVMESLVAQMVKRLPTTRETWV